MNMTEKAERKRTHQINFRVTEQEWQRIKSLYKRTCEGDVRGESIPFNRWAIQLLSEGTVEQIVVAFEPVLLRKQIGEIGNNINQLAHVANATQSFEEPQMRHLQEQFQLLWDLFLKLNDDYNELTTARK